MSFEIEDLALSEQDMQLLRSEKQIKPRSKSIGGKFIPPIPFEWFVTASDSAGLPGALVSSVLWFSYRVRKDNPVRMTKHLRNMFHLDLKTMNRALDKIEQAGIVRVERHQGRGPRVEIIDESIRTTAVPDHGSE